MSLKVIVISWRRLWNSKLCGSHIVVLVLTQNCSLVCLSQCAAPLPLRILLRWMWHKIISPEHWVYWAHNLQTVLFCKSLYILHKYLIGCCLGANSDPKIMLEMSYCENLSEALHKLNDTISMQRAPAWCMCLGMHHVVYTTIYFSVVCEILVCLSHITSIITSAGTTKAKIVPFSNDIQQLQKMAVTCRSKFNKTLSGYYYLLSTQIF